MSQVWLNEMPLDDLGLGLTGAPGHLSGVQWERAFPPSPGLVGGVPGVASVSPARSLVIRGLAELASLTDREALVTSLSRQVTGLQEVRYSDQPDKVFEAILEQVGVSPWEPSQEFVIGDVDIELRFRLAVPYKRDRYGQVISFGTTRTDIPLGDLPSGGVLHIMGSATDPVLTYRGVSGEALRSMTFTITLGSNDYLVVDLNRRVIQKSVAGTVTTDASILTSGYFFQPDPGDGHPGWGGWPSLELSAGTGLYLYHRSWSA